MSAPAPGPGRARPVTLVGLRCSGKTSVGGALARELGGTFADLDEVLAARWAAENSAGAEHASAGEVLARIGIEAFRELEERCLAELLDAGGVRVLATGGGAIERTANRERLARTRCVWLDAPVEVLVARQSRDATLRPPLLGGGDPAAETAELARRRAPLYAEVAELRLDAGAESVARLVERVVEWLAAGESRENP